MYNVKWLASVARDGLDDLVPAIRQAFNDNPTDDRLELVYGNRPRRNIIAIAVVGVIAGHLMARIGALVPLSDFINWSAVLVGATYAALIRRYLFRTDHAGAQDFPWLAASMAPAIVLLMLAELAERLAGGNGESNGVIGSLLVALTGALGTAAAFTIAVAALCFSRNWWRALWDLALRLLMFRLMVFITTLIMLEIGVVGPIVSAVLGSLFDLHIPEWIPELLDQLGYAGVLGIVYLAVIGATWTVCRDSFGELLDSGQVNVLANVERMAKDPVKLEKARQKKLAKQERKRKRREKRDAD